MIDALQKQSLDRFNVPSLEFEVRSSKFEVNLALAEWFQFEVRSSKFEVCR